MSRHAAWSRIRAEHPCAGKAIHWLWSYRAMAINTSQEDGASDEGVDMRISIPAATLAVTVACSTSMMAIAGPADAGTPTGTCTSSYAPYTYAQFAFDPLAQAIFPVIDTNGDGIVCFKFYPNGSHAGHLGNLVDDKAAPHT